MKNETKSAFIAIVGRPNVGKSSFVNAAVGQKVAIVSDKPQTTRTKIMGVCTKEKTQLVFVDTPGFHKPKNKLDQFMTKAAQTGLSDVEAAVLVVEASPKFKFDPENLPPAELELIAEFKKRKLPAVLAVNKIDLLEKKEELLELISAYMKAYDFAAVVPMSAKKQDGVELLVSELLKFSVPAPHFFDADTVTDQPDRIMIAEMVREKILTLCSAEVPHGTAVDIEQFYERDNKEGEPVLEVGATIYCEKDSHKGIIIGRGGGMLKKIGSLARRDIEEFYGCKVSLKLWVKVKEDWRNRGGIIHSLGLDL
ncbi:MAG: GTPase Era [Clostridia bacterium]|nr:GTPase Era [Clostridia bacterium]